MSAQLARKRKDYGTNDDAGGSYGQRNRTLRRVGGRTALQQRSWFNPEFRQQMAAARQVGKQFLNTELQASMASTDEANSEGWDMDELGYFLFRQHRNEYMFGGEEGCGVISMGNDDTSQLGLTQFIADEKKAIYDPTFVPVLGEQSVRVAAAGGLHSVAVTFDGEAYAWGNDDDGCLGRDSGRGAEYPARVTDFLANDGTTHDRSIISAAAGDAHTVYLVLAGLVFMNGLYKDMDSGKFRDIRSMEESPKGYQERPVQVRMPGPVSFIAAGHSFNAAILADGTMVTWGMAHKGALGRSANMTSKNANGQYDLGKDFCYVEYTDKDGDTGMEPNLDVIRKHFLTPLPPIWAGPLLKRTVLSLAAGGHHLLVTAREPGQSAIKLYTCGLNNYGQLGHGDMNDGEEVVTDRHELTLVKELEHDNICKVAAGEHFSAALNLHGTVMWAWGRGDYGQLGIDTRKPGETKIAVGSCETLPQVVRFPGDERVVLSDIACGDRHTLALTFENEVYSWGFNETGPTGRTTVDSEDIYVPTLLDLSRSTKKNVATYKISGGGQHTLLVAKSFR